MPYQTIIRNGDFVRAYKKGKAYVHPHLVMYVNKNRVGKTRVGITASKTVGNAVVRNRARRVIRHALQQVYTQSESHQNLGGFDLVFVARGKTPAQKSTHITKVVQQQLRRAGLLPEEKP